MVVLEESVEVANAMGKLRTSEAVIVDLRGKRYPVSKNETAGASHVVPTDADEHANLVVKETKEGEEDEIKKRETREETNVENSKENENEQLETPADQLE
jgi:hypothetical protein